MGVVTYPGWRYRLPWAVGSNPVGVAEPGRGAGSGALETWRRGAQRVGAEGGGVLWRPLRPGGTVASSSGLQPCALSPARRPFGLPWIETHLWSAACSSPGRRRHSEVADEIRRAVTSSGRPETA